MTLKTAKKRIKQLEQDVIDLQLQFENLDERFSRVDALAKASATQIATLQMGGAKCRAAAQVAAPASSPPRSARRSASARQAPALYARSQGGSGTVG